MSRKMKFFHQLDEKTAETFLAHVHCEVLYIVYLHVQANRQWLLKLSLWFVVGRCSVSFSSMLLCCALCNPMPLQSEAKVIGCSSQFTGSHCSVMMSVKHLLLCLCLIMMMIGHKCEAPATGDFTFLVYILVVAYFFLLTELRMMFLQRQMNKWMMDHIIRLKKIGLLNVLEGKEVPFVTSKKVPIMEMSYF